MSTALEQMADGLAGALAPCQDALKVAIALLPTRTIDYELCARLYRRGGKVSVGRGVGVAGGRGAARTGWMNGRRDRAH